MGKSAGAVSDHDGNCSGLFTTSGVLEMLSHAMMGNKATR